MPAHEDVSVRVFGAALDRDNVIDGRSRGDALRFACRHHGLLEFDLQAPTARARDAFEFGLQPAAGGPDAAILGGGVREGVARPEADHRSDVVFDPAGVYRVDHRLDGGIRGWRRSILARYGFGKKDA